MQKKNYVIFHFKEVAFGKDDYFFMNAMKAYILVDKQYEKYVLKNHTFTRHETSLSVLDNIIGRSDIECMNQLRMDSKKFIFLCKLLFYG